jgi:putative transposase
MPQKDRLIKEAIDQVIGKSRKGRIKIIRMVQRNYPDLGTSRIRRVYEQHGMALTKRLKRRIHLNPANPIELSLAPNMEWGADFMSDALVDGRKIRTFNVVDHFNRECKGITISHSLPARRIIEIFERMIEKYGKPQKIRTDNGPEFTSKRFQSWLTDQEIKWSKIQKGSPWQNAIVERFNRTYREDILDANWFYNTEQAQQITDDWIEDYNNERPHEALDYQTPKQYAA